MSGSSIHGKFCPLGRQLQQRCIFLKVQEEGRLPVRLALYYLSYQVIKQRSQEFRAGAPCASPSLFRKRKNEVGSINYLTGHQEKA